jgi:hypothetical protein
MKWLVSAIVMILTLSSFSLIISKEVFADSFDHSHSTWNDLLKGFTVKKDHQVYVNYRKLKADSSLLNKYLKQLEALSEEQLENFNRDQKLAFWINAYNAYTFKLILENYPIKSIKDINIGWLSFANKFGDGDWFAFGPWKKDFIPLFGKKLSLDNIEHDIIRDKFKEPRIHFAVNCASLGCPSLFQEAFVAEKINEQLDSAALNFLQNKKKNYLKDNTLYVSKIFKWYGTDFDEKHGNCIQYVIETLKLPPKNYKVGLTDYDWSLNDI